MRSSEFSRCPGPCQARGLANAFGVPRCQGCARSHAGYLGDGAGCNDRPFTDLSSVPPAEARVVRW